MRLTAGLGFAMLAALAASPARAQECEPVDRILERIMAETVASRADVTDRLSCWFPRGLSFNATAVTLEVNGFDLLNKVERSFQTWRTPGGEEFVSRRLIDTPLGQAEFRVTAHMQGRKIVRFSAQYLAPR